MVPGNKKQLSQETFGHRANSEKREVAPIGTEATRQRDTNQLMGPADVDTVTTLRMVCFAFLLQMAAATVISKSVYLKVNLLLTQALI